MTGRLGTLITALILITAGLWIALSRRKAPIVFHYSGPSITKEKIHEAIFAVRVRSGHWPDTYEELRSRLGRHPADQVLSIQTPVIEPDGKSARYTVRLFDRLNPSSGTSASLRVEVPAWVP